MKKGDYIYYKDKNGETCPAIIKAVRKDKIENLNFKIVWVKKSNCELQSESP